MSAAIGVTATSDLLVHRIEHVDTDAAEVVHFARYASLLETAVLELLERSGAGLGALAAEGAALAVTELHVRYRQSARYRDLVHGNAGIERVGAAQLRAWSSLHRADADGNRIELVTGELTFACVRADGTPAPLPARQRTILKGLIDNAARAG
jgi:YbgC/YbaW family acyl-CoA thioester hydrolase